MKHAIFLLLMSVNGAIDAVSRLIRGRPATIDAWDALLEKANEHLWPEYDGEGWGDWSGCRLYRPSQNLGCAGFRLRGFYADASWDREIGAPPRLFVNAWGRRFYVTKHGIRKVR